MIILVAKYFSYTFYSGVLVVTANILYLWILQEVVDREVASGHVVPSRVGYSRIGCPVAPANIA
jgi:hypothetical protein